MGSPSPLTRGRTQTYLRAMCVSAAPIANTRPLVEPQITSDGRAQRGRLLGSRMVRALVWWFRAQSTQETGPSRRWRRLRMLTTENVPEKWRVAEDVETAPSQNSPRHAKKVQNTSTPCYQCPGRAADIHFATVLTRNQPSGRRGCGA